MPDPIPDNSTPAATQPVTGACPTAAGKPQDRHPGAMKGALVDPENPPNVPGAGQPISIDARRQLALLVAVGCDRATAASFVGISPQALERATVDDASLARELTRAEASAELAHVRCIQQATHDPNNWRASAWWLERMRPQLYTKQGPNAPTKADLRAWTQHVVDAVDAEVADDVLRQRILDRLAGRIR